MIKLKKYKMLADSKINSKVKRGDIVYDSKGWDYGCANDDGRKEIRYIDSQSSLLSRGGRALYKDAINSIKKDKKNAS